MLPIFFRFVVFVAPRTLPNAEVFGKFTDVGDELTPDVELFHEHGYSAVLALLHDLAHPLDVARSALRTALRANDLTEYAVVREDHYGWGDGYATVVANSNWNWDTFMSNINGSEITITVTNCGDNTANIRYHVIYANGEEHFQYYDNLGVNSSDLIFCNIVEEAYLNYL